MDLRRLRGAEWLAALSGVALLVALWLPWYGAQAGSLSAWEALAALDVPLALVAAAGVALALITATQRVPAIPVALAAFVTLAGVVGVLLVLLRVLDVPDGAGGREWGLWVALAASAGIVAGAWWAMTDESGPAKEAAPIESLPAPRPE